MTDFLCSEEVSLVFARGMYQRDMHGSKLVPVLVKRPTPETGRQWGDLCFRSMRGSDLTGAGSKGQAARTAGRTSHDVTKHPYWWQSTQQKAPKACDVYLTSGRWAGNQDCSLVRAGARQRHPSPGETEK